MQRSHLIRLHPVHQSIGSGTTTKNLIVQPAATSAYPKVPLYIVEHAYLGKCPAYVHAELSSRDQVEPQVGCERVVSRLSKMRKDTATAYLEKRRRRTNECYSS